MASPLADLRVLDLSVSAAGSYCAKILAYMGADVIKIEPPGRGNPLRYVGPFGNNQSDPERSGLFLYLNTSKRGITLNLETEDGKGILARLAKDADVVVETFESDVREKVGLSYNSLRELRPDIVVTSITNFEEGGRYEHYKANDLVLSAMGGVMYLHGEPEDEPLKFGGMQPSYQAGLIGYTSTVTALYWRLMTGEGQHVDVSARDVVASSIEGSSAQYSYLGLIRRRGIRRFIYGHPFDVYPCRDGHLFIIPGLGNMEYLALLVEQPELIEHPLFKNRRERQVRYAEFDQLILPWLMKHDKTDIEARAQELRMPFGAVLNLGEVLDDPQLAERGFFAHIDHPVAGLLKYPTQAFRMSEGEARHERAPLLGEHNEEIYRSLGYSDEDLACLRESGII